MSHGGVSEYSDIGNIMMEPEKPGACPPPRTFGKPKPNSLHLKWNYPEVDGGSKITEYEVDMTTNDNRTKMVYGGERTECLVASLLPGRVYLFQVRAYNKMGAGPFSDSLEIVSGAGAPDQPKAPKAVCRGPTVATIEWEAPIANGALVSAYQLQMAIVSSQKCLSPPPQESIPMHDSSSASETSSSVVTQDFDDIDNEEEADEERQESPVSILKGL